MPQLIHCPPQIIHRRRYLIHAIPHRHALPLPAAAACLPRLYGLEVVGELGGVSQANLQGGVGEVLGSDIVGVELSWRLDLRSVSEGVTCFSFSKLVLEKSHTG
ncbi:uncharacterized protein G2W53_011690 [Senna tora]|uniref:Uncharacterized protein n=1 Tax=Senna tora TaxID=362788 RepID=A0A835CB12_9FABA|nr:uncharacterized protein G2W53_011690 [Senna tora]